MATHLIPYQQRVVAVVTRLSGRSGLLIMNGAVALPIHASDTHVGMGLTYGGRLDRVGAVLGSKGRKPVPETAKGPGISRNP